VNRHHSIIGKTGRGTGATITGALLADALPAGLGGLIFDPLAELASRAPRAGDDAGWTPPDLGEGNSARARSQVTVNISLEDAPSPLGGEADSVCIRVELIISSVPEVPGDL